MYQDKRSRFHRNLVELSRGVLFHFLSNFERDNRTYIDSGLTRVIENKRLYMLESDWSVRSLGLLLLLDSFLVSAGARNYDAQAHTSRWLKVRSSPSSRAQPFPLRIVDHVVYSLFASSLLQQFPQLARRNSTIVRFRPAMDGLLTGVALQVVAPPT